MVYLKFAEIDIQNKMDQEKHALEMFEGNGLTYDEFRVELGRDPIAIPESGDDQDPGKYPQWFKTYWKLFEEPLNIIRAIDEAYTPQAQMVAEARSTSITAKQLASAQQAKEKEQQAEIKAKAAAAPSKPLVAQTTKDHLLNAAFSELERDVLEKVAFSIEEKGIIDFEYLRSVAYTWATYVIEKFSPSVYSSLRKGFSDTAGVPSSSAILSLKRTEKDIDDRLEHFVNRLAVNTISLIRRRVDRELGVRIGVGTPSPVQIIHEAFEAMQFRSEFIYETEREKAYKYGKLLGYSFVGVERIAFSVEADGEACDMCQAKSERTYFINSQSLDDVAPFHPGCRCVAIPKESHTIESAESEGVDGRLAASVLDFIGPQVRPGVTTGALDRHCHEYILAHDAIPAPLTTKGSPSRSARRSTTWCVTGFPVIWCCTRATSSTSTSR